MSQWLFKVLFICSLLVTHLIIKAQTDDDFYKSGDIKARNGDLIGAKNDFTNSIKINPNNSQAYTSRGVQNFNLNYVIEAIADFNKSLELNPDDEITYYCRAVAKTKLGEYKSAIQDFTKANTSNLPETFKAEVLMNRGAAKTQVGDYWGAISDFNISIEIDPTNPKTYYFRGIAKIILNQKENGCLDLSKSGELGYDEAYNTIKTQCN